MATVSRLHPQIWRWHFWVGLWVTPVLLIVSLTGALYAFEPQLRPLLEPAWSHPPCENACQRLSYQRLLETAEARFPQRVATHLENPGAGYSIQVEMQTRGQPDSDERIVFVDPHTGRILADHRKGTGLLDQVLALHRRLLAGTLGNYLVELAISWVLVTLILGLVLWWPGARRFRGGWWLRRGARGRLRWRDWHSVFGLYLLPLALLLTATGLFLAPLAQKSVIGMMYLADQIPALYLREPNVEPPDAATRPLPLDDFIADFTADGSAREFSVHLPSAADEPLEISAHIGREVSRLQIAFYDPYRGQRLGTMRWDELAPGAKALLLLFPLHTGNIAGLAGQIVVCIASLMLAAITLFGLWMWWLRRPPGKLGAPAGTDHAPLPWWLWPTAAGLGILLPAFGVSMLALLAWHGMRLLTRYVRRARSRQ